MKAITYYATMGVYKMSSTRNYLLSLLCFMTISSQAQKRLLFEDVSTDNDTYVNDDHLAGIKINCDKGLSLSFAYAENGSAEQSNEPFYKSTEDQDSIYYLSIKPTNLAINGTLSISAKGYDTEYVALNPQPNKLIKLKVYDETARNEQLKKEELQASLAAQNQHVPAYGPGVSMYTNTEELERMEATEEIQETFFEADRLYRSFRLKKALPLFRKVAGENKALSIIAQKRVNMIDAHLRDRGDRPRVITYEYMKGLPIGFHFGTYKDRKTGGYFHLNLHTDIISFISDKGETGNHPQLDFGGGLTFKLLRPVWLYAGLGMTGKVYYGYGISGMDINEDGYPTDGYDYSSYEGTKPDAYVSASVNPELGITVKYEWLTLRVGAIYRWSIKKAWQDYLGRVMLNVGIGIAY